MEGPVAYLPIHCLVCARLLIQESRVRNEKFPPLCQPYAFIL